MSLSYSAISLYNGCPSRYKRQYIDKEPVPEQPEQEGESPMERGKRLHEEAEKYILGQQDTLPVEIMHCLDLVQMIREKGGMSEVQWAFDSEWVACDFDYPGLAIRGVIDAILIDEEEGVIHVYEFKTGKKYPDHESQKTLYGLAALLMYTEYDKCVVHNVYFDAKTKRGAFPEPTEFVRDTMIAQKWLWEKRMDLVTTDKKYYPRPSYRCAYCPYSERVGGTCPN